MAMQKGATNLTAPLGYSSDTTTAGDIGEVVKNLLPGKLFLLAQGPGLFRIPVEEAESIMSLK